jgi:hypothetical protein
VPANPGPAETPSLGGKPVRVVTKVESPFESEQEAASGHSSTTALRALDLVDLARAGGGRAVDPSGVPSTFDNDSGRRWGPGRRRLSASLSGPPTGITRGRRTGVCLRVPGSSADELRTCLCDLGVSGLPSPPATQSRMPFVLTTPGGQPVSLLGKPAAIPRCISVRMSERYATLSLSISNDSVIPRIGHSGDLAFNGRGAFPARAERPPLPPIATMGAELAASSRESVA